MRRTRSAVALLLGGLLAGATGCDRTTTVSRGPVRLGPAEVRLESDGLAVRGRQADLCVVMPPGAAYSAVTGRTTDPHGRPIDLSARLVSPSGQSVDLGRPGTLVGQEIRLCFSPDGQLSEGQTYRAVVLRASDTVTVSAVTWWSGEHTKLLP